MGDRIPQTSIRISSHRPPPVPALRPSSTLSSIHQGCRETKFLFRVHSSSSVSPLVWTGDISSSGFSTPNEHMAYISPKIYEKIYVPELISPPADLVHVRQRHHLPAKPLASISGSRMAIGPYLRHTMMDHILEKMKQTCIPLLNTVEDVSDGVFQDEKTPWISTSSEAFWCIWDIARRLSLPAWAGREDQVELAVIRHPLSKQNSQDDHHHHHLKSQSKQVSDGHKSKSSSRSPNELYLHPAQHLHRTRNMHFNGEMTLSLLESYDVSRKAAVMSGEVLFFARIFAENVLENHVFTRKATPFSLPEQLLKCQSSTIPIPQEEELDNKPTPLASEWLKSRQDEKSSSRGKESSWLDELVWDPRTDEYPAAREKVLNRRREMSSDKKWINEPL